MFGIAIGHYSFIDTIDTLRFLHTFLPLSPASPFEIVFHIFMNLLGIRCFNLLTFYLFPQKRFELSYNHGICFIIIEYYYQFTYIKSLFYLAC